MTVLRRRKISERQPIGYRPGEATRSRDRGDLDGIWRMGKEKAPGLIGQGLKNYGCGGRI
jgi:hypothetical protein